MQLTDIAPLEQWTELADQWSSEAGMTTAVYDLDNRSLIERTRPCNPLCPAVREVPDALTGLCAVAQQGLAGMARKTGAPVIEECDAGMIKIVVPVLVGGEMIGSVSGCGRRFPDSEIEIDYLSDLSGLEADSLEEKAAATPVIDEAAAEALAAALAARVEALVAA